MKIENLRIERDYDDEWFIEVEHPVNNIKIGYAAERVLAEEVVKYALDQSDVKFMTVSLRDDNVLIYRATFPQDATMAHIIVVMQDVINEAERHIRYMRALLEIVDLNRKEQHEQ